LSAPWVGSQLDNVTGLGYPGDQPAGPERHDVVLGAVDVPDAGIHRSASTSSAATGPGRRAASQAAGPVNSYKICGSKIDPPLPCVGHSHGTVSIGAGNVEGAGVWIVDGDLELAGTLDFVGLIIVKGNTTTKKDPGTGLTGNASVYGSLWSWDVQVQRRRVGHGDVQHERAHAREPGGGRPGAADDGPGELARELRRGPGW
jgi:hypothetical protein